MRNSLAQLRAAKEWSQGDLADKLGVSRQTVNALERGKYDPSLPLASRSPGCSVGGSKMSSTRRNNDLSLRLDRR